MIEREASFGDPLKWIPSTHPADRMIGREYMDYTRSIHESNAFPVAHGHEPG